MPECSPDSVKPASGALGLLVHGFPMSRTLDAAAAVAAGLQPQTGAAILLVQDGRLVLAAEYHLNTADMGRIENLCLAGGTDSLAEFRHQHAVEVRPFITHAAELVGVLLVFGLSAAVDPGRIAAQLDEVCAIATVAIEQQHLVEELAYRAHRDPLTHLWNRIWMEEEITRILETALETGRYTGLLLIGIDSFRLINELLGSQAGNELLRMVGVRLMDALEPGFVLARGGGDEFVVLLPNLTSPQRVSTFASQLLAWFDKPFEIGDHELLVRTSIGVATAAPGEGGSDELQSRADTALRYAKKSARGRAVAFDQSMITTPPSGSSWKSISALLCRSANSKFTISPKFICPPAHCWEPKRF